jgi:hypothetical protein
MRQYENTVQAFLVTDDETILKRQPAPFPVADWLRDVLRNRNIRAILPVSVRESVHVGGFSETDPAALAHRRIQVVPAHSEWRSDAIRPSFGWWKIETKGAIGPGADAMTVRIVDERTGAMIGVVAPTKLAGDSWRAAYVRAPRVASHLAATAGTSAIAVSEPTEISWLSFRVWQLCRQGTWIFFLGALTLVLATLAPVFGTVRLTRARE